MNDPEQFWIYFSVTFEVKLMSDNRRETFSAYILTALAEEQ